eukprot:7175873-Pyramimonas_sp.AAC.1
MWLLGVNPQRRVSPRLPFHASVPRVSMSTPLARWAGPPEAILSAPLTRTVEAGELHLRPPWKSPHGVPGT